MSTGGHKVVVGNDDRRGLQIARATLAQTAHKIIAHFGEVYTDERQVVLADVPQHTVDPMRTQHPIVTLLAIDGGATWIGQVTD